MKQCDTEKEVDSGVEGPGSMLCPMQNLESNQNKQMINLFST